MDGSVRHRVVGVLRAIVHEARAEKVTFMAGSIAYHAFVSLLPFLLFILFVVSTFGSPDLAERIVTSAGTYLTQESTGLLVNVVTAASRSRSVSVIGLAVLLWGTLKIFRSLDTAFSDIYESEQANTLPDQFLDAAIVFGALGLGIVVVGAVDSLVIAGGSTLGPARPVLVVVALALAFFPIYYIFPDESVSVREVLPGVFFAAVGWTLLESVFQFYVDVASKSEYGILGVILLLITWLYFSGLVVLLGAVINAVLAGRSEDTAGLDWADPATADGNPALALAFGVGGAGDGGDGREAGDDRPPARGDPFLDGVRRLRGVVDDETPVTVGVGDTEVTLPPPTTHDVGTTVVDRPRLLGGYRERGRVVLRWEASRPAASDENDDASVSTADGDASAGTDRRDAPPGTDDGDGHRSPGSGS